MNYINFRCCGGDEVDTVEDVRHLSLTEKMELLHEYLLSGAGYYLSKRASNHYYEELKQQLEQENNQCQLL